MKTIKIYPQITNHSLIFKIQFKHAEQMKLFHFILTQFHPQILPVIGPLVSQREKLIKSPIQISATDLGLNAH